MGSSETEQTLRWHDPSWLAEATAWIDAHVARSGDVEQPHAYPWATALRVPTNDGVVWFKACTEFFAHEVTTLELLGARRPELVPRMLGGDHERAWMLLADAGTRLRDLQDDPGQLERWQRAAAAYGELQLEAAVDVDRFVAAGVPDRRGHLLVAQFEQVVADERALAASEEGLDEAERVRARALVPRVEADVAALAALGLPDTIQHDDFHDGNVFVDGDAIRVIDWGDACVVNPLLSMHVMLGALAWRFGVEPDAPEVARVRDAYLEPFTSVRTRDELASALPVVQRLGVAGGAIKWHSIVATLPEETRGPYADGAPGKVRQLLALCG